MFRDVGLLRIVSVLALAGLMALAGCGEKADKDVAERQAADRGPQDAASADAETGAVGHKGGTLIIGTEADADALNPIASSTVQASDVYGNLFCYLCKIEPDMQSYGPWMAESWEFSDDRLTLIFHLRDDIYWHDGVQMTASDVEYSFSIHKDPACAWSIIRWLDHITSVTAVDSFTVEVKFDEVYPYQLTDANVFRPLPKHLLEHIPPEEMRTAEFNRNPVGNGPFKFKRWVPQQYIELTANDDYFLGRPHLDRVIWKVVPDRTNLLTQLERGEIDFYHHFPPEAYERLSKNPNLKIYRFPSRSYTYVAWNLRNPLFANRNVRRALNMAINRQEIVDQLFYGLGKPAPGPFLPFIWAYDPDLKQLPYDPERSKRILAEEGWEDTDGDGWLDKDGLKFEFTMKTNENNTQRKDITIVLQDKFKDLGIKVNPVYREWTMFVSEVQGRDFDSVVSGWSTGIKADLTTYWHSKSIDDKFNYVGYSNPRVDELIDLAKMEIDRDKAKELWSEAQQLIVDDAPYCFLLNLDDLNALHRRFKNVRMITYGWDYYLPEWYVPEEEIKRAGATE
jgi:peptide/nickel transport system substrate-binding protein